MLARYGFASTLIAAAQIDCVKLPLTGAAVASEKTGTAKARRHRWARLHDRAQKERYEGH